MTVEGAYTGRSVLVTGADGFIGSHLVERLAGEGARVGALVRPTSTTGTVGFKLKNLDPERVDALIATDIAGPDAVEAMLDFQPEVIFHLAADAYVERSFRAPGEVTRTNLGGTMNVLAAARRQSNLRRVVITSSSEVYGPAQTDKIDESHPLEPTSPYAASKVAADRMAVAFHRTYNLPIAVIRPFNTFGPRHHYDVIPKFIARALAGEPLIVYGDGKQSRDFTYVDDMVRAFTLIGDRREAVGGVLNFGSGDAIAIARLAELVIDIAGSSSSIEHAPARAAEVQRLRCDSSRALELLSWQPTISLADGLRRNIEWARCSDS